MRKANTNDLFNVARLVNELDLKDVIFNAQKGKEDVERIGFDLVIDVFAKATTKESQMKIYEVLAQPFEMEVEEVGMLELDKLIEAFTTCFDFQTVVNFIKRVNR